MTMLLRAGGLLALLRGTNTPPRSWPRPPRMNMPSEKRLRSALVYPETLPLAPPATPFDPARMDLHWIVPGLHEGSGGHMTIFRMVRFLEAFGHRCTVWIDGGARGGPERALESIARWYVPIKGPVRGFFGAPSEIEGDAVIATEAWTAYPARAVTRVRRRFYFVQDFEPWFWPMGTAYALTEETYRFGFSCLTAGDWLAERLHADYGADVDPFVLACDHGIYAQRPDVERETGRVAYYLRPNTPRRGSEIGLLALEVLAARRRNLRVDFFGADVDKFDAPYDVTWHGILSPAELARLYARATVGVVFSLSNYSLVPQEMMACGLPVVDLDGANTRRDLPGVVRLAPRTPKGVADAVDTLLADAAERTALANRGLAFVADRTWERTARTIENALVRRLAEKR